MERLTLEEAAKKLGIPKEAARNRVKRGTLPSTTDSGGQVYVCVSTETGAGTASDAHAGQPNNPSGGRYPLWYFAPEESSHHAPLFSSDDTHRWEFRRPPEPPTRGGVQGWWDWLRRRPAFRGKTGWDWAELLLVPLLLTLATIVFAFVQDRRQDYIANQRTQDSTLQAYLSQMSDLMIDEHGTELRKLDPDAEVRALMRARTSTVLRNLDGN